MPTAFTPMEFNFQDLPTSVVFYQLCSEKRIPFFPLYAERENNPTQFKLGIRRNVFQDVWVNAGPTFNFGYAYLPESTSYTPIGEDLQPYLWDVAAKRSSDFLGWNTRFWVEFHAGISFN